MDWLYNQYRFCGGAMERVSGGGKYDDIGVGCWRNGFDLICFVLVLVVLGILMSRVATLDAEGSRLTMKKRSSSSQFNLSHNWILA